GVQIYSTFPGNEYRTFNGTSMATPYVAGLVAVMKSLRPELTAKEAFSILHDTGLPTKSGKETGRLINPGAAVKKLMD
ncbi:MAG TPA: subtilisin, partial [Bacteroidetes bacterium]|nr:subtilisin [Bacteroidota bacterium]